MNELDRLKELIAEKGINAIQQMPDVAKRYIEYCSLLHKIGIYISIGLYGLSLLMIILGIKEKDRDYKLNFIMGAIIVMIIATVIMVHNQIMLFKIESIPEVYILDDIIKNLK